MAYLFRPGAVAAERGNPAPQRRPGGRCGRSRTPSPTTPPTASPSRADAAEAQTGFADAAWKTARPEPRALHHGQPAAEPPPRSAATGSAVTARGRRGSSRTFLAVAGAPEAGRPAPRARPGRQRGRSRAPRLGYNAAEPSSRSTGTGSGVTARGRCGRSRTPLTAGKAVDRGPASPGQRPALTVASRGPRPEARTTPILDMWGRHAGSGGDPEETDHLKRAPTRCKTVSVHVGMYRNLAPA